MYTENMNNYPAAEHLAILSKNPQKVEKKLKIVHQNTPAMNVIEKETESMINGQKSKRTHLNNNPDDKDVIRYAKQIIENNTRISPEASLNLAGMMLSERSDILAVLYKLIDATEDVLCAHSQLPVHISLEENQMRCEIKRLKAARENAAAMFPNLFFE